MHLEHINLTVSDPRRTASMLGTLFGWRIRWEGESLDNGYSIHVGTDDQYLALYTPEGDTRQTQNSYTRAGGMNHIGVVVSDLDAIEKRVKEHGFAPHNYGDYEPGRRFYFNDADNIEFEVVSYATS